MTENKRLTIIQDGDNFIVRDNLKNKPIGVFEFKEDEFPVYFCFHKIIDLLNELAEEKQEYQKEIEKLKEISDNKQKHIVHLENKIHRMRNEIKRLDRLPKKCGVL